MSLQKFRLTSLFYTNWYPYYAGQYYGPWIRHHHSSCGLCSQYSTALFNTLHIFHEFPKKRSEDFFIYFPPWRQLLRLAVLFLYFKTTFSRTEGGDSCNLQNELQEGRNLSKSYTLYCTLGIASCVNREHTGHIAEVQIQRDLCVLKQYINDKQFTPRASFCYLKLTVFIMTEDYLRLGLRFHQIYQAPRGGSPFSLRVHLRIFWTEVKLSWPRSVG